MAITETRLTPSTGVEIGGLSGGRLVDPEVADDCRRALDERGVVIYREADVDDDQLVAFSRLLGDVVPLPMGGHDSYREIQRITRDASKSKLAAYREGTFFWHIDGTTDAVPEQGHAPDRTEGVRRRRRRHRVRQHLRRLRRAAGAGEGRSRGCPRRAQLRRGAAARVSQPVTGGAGRLGP